ncbi:MAG: MMPL family transporter [Dactylosporangium sp.]|nr:MMPL family transporter [Dactylosporangium sp.]NNJ61615.1 MMPL family transporter [Dactylosporangium sp.]
MTTTIESRSRGPEPGRISSTATRLLARLPSGRRGKYLTVGLWLVLVAVCVPLAADLAQMEDNEQLGSLPAAAEVERAQTRLDQAFPESDALVAIAVYARDGGLTPADQTKVSADRAAFTRYAEGGTVGQPTVSADGAALLVSFRVPGDEDEQEETTGKIRDRLAADVPAGLRTALTGSAGAEADVSDAFSGMDSALLLATALTVTLLLVVIYRSPLLWLVPLVAAAVANQVANAVVYGLAKSGGLTVDFQSRSILTVLVFGVGVDYALLIISRYREQLRLTIDRHTAMATALRGVFPALAASAGTVIVGLLCLTAADLPATRGLGAVGAAGIATTFLAMVTLLPALLVLCGRPLFWPFVPRAGAGVERHGIWRRIADGVAGRPRTVWIAAVLVLCALSLGVTRLGIGMPDDEYFTTEVGSVTGQHLMEQHFPAGMIQPAEIVAAAGSGDRVVEAARDVSGVATVEPAETSADGRWVRVRAILDDDSGSAAQATVERLRTAVHAVPGARALVAGEAAETLDTERITARDNWVVMPLILGVVLLVLALLLRSLVAPVLLLASVVLSYVAAMGAGGLVLEALGHPRLWEALPLLAFLFLVALGVDYTIFLMARAREETVRWGHRAGMLRALMVTGGVITSAGIVLAATFASLGVLPLVPSVQTGVIIALGVLLDTMVVRTLLVPALTLDLGPVTWWPTRISVPEVRPGRPLSR